MGTSMVSQISAGYEAFTSSFDTQGYASLMDSATSVGQERMIANSIRSLPIAQLLSYVAKSIGSTISVGFSFDAVVLSSMQTWDLNTIFGEDGQFAVPRNRVWL